MTSSVFYLVVGLALVEIFVVQVVVVQIQIVVVAVVLYEKVALKVGYHSIFLKKEKGIMIQLQYYF